MNMNSNAMSLNEIRRKRQRQKPNYIGEILAWVIHAIHESIRSVLVGGLWILNRLHQFKIRVSSLVLILGVLAIPAAFYGGITMKISQEKTGPTFIGPIELAVKGEKAALPKTVYPTKPATPPQVMNEQTFSSELHSVFPTVAHPDFKGIYQNALKDNLPPYFVAGIAWKETTFNPTLTSPWTTYGYSRGEMQILDATAESFGYNPNLSYNQQRNIAEGTYILEIYSDDFAGIGNIPSWYQQHFRLIRDKSGQLEVDYLLPNYQWHPVVDQNGTAVPRLVLAALAYNGGPGSIIQVLNANHGVLVMNPILRAKQLAKGETMTTLTFQQMDYIWKINKYMYNFGYRFPYTDAEIPKNQILSN